MLKPIENKLCLEGIDIEEAIIRKQSSFLYMRRIQVEKTSIFFIILTQMRFQLTIFFSLLLTASAVNWQAADNITESNRTFIWDTINNNIAIYVPYLSPFATYISTTLNNEWDPAWNVFVIRLIDPTVDAVVYGYAFRKHWMWFNGYTFDGNTYSFVIWKDYNCHTWHTILNSNRQTVFGSSVPNYSISQALNTVLNDGQYDAVYTQIWASIYELAKKMEANTGRVYSIVAVQNGPGSTDVVNRMNGRFCSAGGEESFLFSTLVTGDQQDNRFKIVYIRTR